MRRDIGFFLFCIGILFFSWPLMFIFREHLQHYLFIIWSVFIVLIYLLVRRSERNNGGG